jgi:hypothetical protein
MPKNKGKSAHLGVRLVRPHSQSAMSCGLPALIKFLSAPHNYIKYVVIHGLAVMVGKLW